MLRLSHIALLAGILATAANCEVYDESLLLNGRGGSGGTSSMENGLGWWSGTDVETKCATADIPRSEDRPSTRDDANALDPIVLAIRNMRLGSINTKGEPDPTAWQDIGFDLDGTCTRSPTCEQIEPIVSCRTMDLAPVPADGNFCRDNMFGRLQDAIHSSEDVGARFGLNDRTFNCSLCQGAYNMLFKLSGYNGRRNDALVRVDIYPSPGIHELKPIDCSTASDWNQEEVCWKKEDKWAIQSKFVDQPVGSTTIGESTIDDPNAYVRDGYVVARLPDNTRFWLPGYRGVATAFPLIVEGGLVTGRLDRDADGAWGIADGIIAGRIEVQDVIDGFRFIGNCEGDPSELYVAGYARSWADVLRSGEVLPDAPCDALSMGLAFTGAEATMGAVVEVEESDPCAPVADAGADAGADAAPDGGS